MNHLKDIHESNFTEIIDNETNNLQLINVAQVENTSPSDPSDPCDNLNISCEISDQASNATNGYEESSNSSSMDNQFATSAQSYPTINSSSHVPQYNRIFRIHRIQRQLRREIMISNIYILNHIRRIPSQITNDSFTNQFFNGSPF